MDNETRTGHRIAALANLSVVPALFAYFELQGHPELTKVVACSVAYVVITYAVIRMALEANQAGQHDNNRNETYEQPIQK